MADQRTKDQDATRSHKNKAITEDTDLVGVIAEGEFAKAYDLPFVNYSTPGGDAGFDFTLPDGRTVNVKGTGKIDGNLLVAAAPRKTKSTVADLYVLAIVNKKDETADFVGWTTRDKVLAAKVRFMGKNRYNPVYFVPREELNPMEELFEPVSV